VSEKDEAMTVCKFCWKEIRTADGIKGHATMKVCAKCGRSGCPSCVKTERCITCEAKRPKPLDGPSRLAVSSKDIEG
jgi:hypothetical protein